MGAEVKLNFRYILFLTLLISAGISIAQSRLPPLSADQYTAEQKKAAEEFEMVRKKAPWGPFAMLMYSPEVMNNARAMGDYLRYRSAIGNNLSEFAILITAREWSQDYEWSIHYPLAIQAGIKPEIVNAIKDGHYPRGMSPDEEIVYDFTIELQRYKRVSDASFDRAEKRFGKKGVVDLAGIAGYYTLLAMEMNMARHPPSGNGEKLPRFPE